MRWSGPGLEAEASEASEGGWNGDFMRKIMEKRLEQMEKHGKQIMGKHGKDGSIIGKYGKSWEKMGNSLKSMDV